MKSEEEITRLKTGEARNVICPKPNVLKSRGEHYTTSCVMKILGSLNLSVPLILW
jgi:hypothetical protein